MLDLDLRKRTRLAYPGACSLEYQSQVQILIQCLLQWDSKTQKAKGKFILGTKYAFAPADEEQGRGTLHSHWQVWVRELNQHLQHLVYNRDNAQKEACKHELLKHINIVTNATYGLDLTVTNTCNSSEKRGIADNFFVNRINQVMCDAWHKKLCHKVKGQIMKYPECKKQVSTTDIVTLTLADWKTKTSKGKVGMLLDISLPISSQ